MDEKQKEYILVNVIYKVVNADRNRQILESVPHKTFLDLAAVYVVLIESDNDDIGYILDNGIMENVGITFDDLDNAAYSNSETIGFIKYRLFGDMPLILGKGNNYGAGAFLYPEYIRQISEEDGGCDLYILPSSVHELIAISDDITYTVEELREIVMDMNSDSKYVGESDFLSNNIYKYIAAENKIIML